jgi:hypothetical protein
MTIFSADLTFVLKNSLTCLFNNASAISVVNYFLLR